MELGSRYVSVILSTDTTYAVFWDSLIKLKALVKRKR